MTSNSNCFVTLILLLHLHSSEVVFGSKILFIPANVYSHVQLFSHLAANLAQLGHVTRVVVPSSAQVPNFTGKVDNGGNFSYTAYPVPENESFADSRNMSEAILRLAVSHSVWEKFAIMSRLVSDFESHCESDCFHLLDNDQLINQVRTDSYQFVVVDPTERKCYLAIPYSLGIPYAILSIPVITWSYRVPRLPSFAPLLGFTYTDRKSFAQRLTSFLVEQLLLLGKLVRNTTTVYADRFAPERPSLDQHQLMLRVRLTSISPHADPVFCRLPFGYRI